MTILLVSRPDCGPHFVVTMKDTEIQTFDAKVVSMGEGGAWKCIIIPFDVLKAFGTRARLSVEGTINGARYRTSIFPMSNGRFMMMINKALQREAHLSEGDSVQVSMASAGPAPALMIPAELESALAKNRQAHSAFDKLSPSHRKEHLKYVSEAKQAPTRIRRAAKVVKMLLKRGTITARLIAAVFCLSSGPSAPGIEPAVDPAELPRILPTEPARALSTFKLRPGVRLELMAAEPLVVDPIALCFDEDSRLFVVEMRDYSERREERLGRIRLLEDTDGDGNFDKATVFAEGLPWPTALCWFDGGLFVGSTPDIYYFKDTDGDGKADQKHLVFTGFGSGVERLNVQQLFNSLTWTVDGRIHGASGGNGGLIRCPDHPDYPAVDLKNADFSFDPRTFEMRRESGGGQYGLSFDNAGRKFVCSNSAHIRQVVYDQSWILPDMNYALPSPAVDIPVDGPAAEVYRVSPDEPWRVLRTKWRVAGLVPGPIEGGGRPSGYFTGATGLTIYRGTALGPEFVGDAFIADIGSNLVHRKKLRSNGVAFKAERAADEQHSEFLASTDNWFRPVTFANAPDGALYVIDMYREVVEHPWSLPPNIKKHLDLNSGNDRGRIYRVVANDFKQSPWPKLSRATSSELVDLLRHPNGWHRDTALRLIYERQDRAIVPAIRLLLGHSTDSIAGQICALYALKSLSALTDADLLLALRSAQADVRQTALRLVREQKSVGPSVESQLRRMASDSSAQVRFQLAWAIAALDLTEKRSLLRTFAARATDPWERHAAFAAVSRDRTLETEIPGAFTHRTRSKPNVQPSVVLTNNVSTARAEVIKAYVGSLQQRGDAAKGKPIYLERCASCHRLFGQGTPVGPDLESVRSAGTETILNNVLDPNREINPRFVTQEIKTKGGEEWTGIIANDAPNGVTLRLANGVEQFISRFEIESIRPTGRSLMPEGLEAGLKPEDLANLLAYISGEQ